MRNNRPNGMSQLDYLWTYFGQYQVSQGVEGNLDPTKIVTETVLKEYLDKYTQGYIEDMKLVPKGQDKLELLGIANNGETISIVEFDKENSLVNVQLIMSTQVEIDNNICNELNVPLLVFTMKDGKKYYVSLSQFVYYGGETSSIKTSVVGTKISAHLKLDKSIDQPIVDVNITDNGLKVDLTLADQSNNQLKLVRTTKGLDTTYTWDDGNNILFQCLTYNQYHSLAQHVPGKIYFITDAMCIYLNEVRYGDNLSLLSTDTIEIINNGNVLSMEVRLDSDQFNLLSKSQAGLAAKLYWEE